MLQWTDRSFRPSILVVLLAVSVITGSLPEPSFALQSLNNEDLRKIDGKEGLSEGFSSQFGSFSDFEPSPARPGPFLDTQSDTPFLGELILSDLLWFSDLQYLLIDDNLDSLRTITRNQRSLFRTPDPILRDEDFFLNKEGVPRSTTGPIPDSLRGSHDL
jgi:hypothetical protein